MLGMGNATAAVTRGRFGQGHPSMPIWMDDVDCKGNELNGIPSFAAQRGEINGNFIFSRRIPTLHLKLSLTNGTSLLRSRFRLVTQRWEDTRLEAI